MIPLCFVSDDVGCTVVDVGYKANVADFTADVVDCGT